MKQSNNNERIHIVLTPGDLSDEYNRHAGATLISILEHSSLPVTAHLLYDKKLSDGKDAEEMYIRKCYQKISETYHCDIIYHHVTLPEWVNKLPAMSRWHVSTLYRLLLPEILQDVDKILYLDCDMIVLTDIVSLYNTPINNYPLAACLDSARINLSKKRNNKLQKYYSKYNIPRENYFCAGTILFNLNYIRNNYPDFTKRAISYLLENHKLEYLDQDVLNWFCHGNYLQLNQKYNIYHSRADAEEFQSDCILHFASICKPWKVHNGPLDDYYWHYLLKTPWCEDSRKIVEYIRQAPDTPTSMATLPKYWHVQYGVGRTKRCLSAIKLCFFLLASELSVIFKIIFKR